MAATPATPALPLPVPAASAASTAVAPAASPTTATASREARRRANTAAPHASAPESRRAATRTASATAASAAAGSGPGALPDALRHELPTLAFGGASYSKDAASRMVIFNGRVFHEGDTLAPQLVLEQIKLKAAVFTYKGYRYELAF